MAYRNDLDAALARIGALEIEKEQVRLENEKALKETNALVLSLKKENKALKSPLASFGSSDVANVTGCLMAFLGLLIGVALVGKTIEWILVCLWNL